MKRKNLLPPGTILVDVETTGLDPHKHSIIEVSMITPEGETFTCECRPRLGSAIDAEALAVTGTTPGMLEERSVSHTTMVHRLAMFLGRSAPILAGQNVHFDLSFLRAAVADLPPHRRPRFSSRVLDLHTLAMAAFGQSLNSEQIAMALGLQPEQTAHSAKSGTEWELAALEILLTRFSK